MRLAFNSSFIPHGLHFFVARVTLALLHCSLARLTLTLPLQPHFTSPTHHGPPNNDSPTSPLKLFELAKSQKRFLYTSAPMVRYSKASPPYPLTSENTRDHVPNNHPARLPQNRPRIRHRPLLDPHDPRQRVQPQPIRAGQRFVASPPLPPSTSHSPPLDFTISTPQPPTIVQFGANVPLELARASSLVAPFASGVDLNCGCPQSWACAETLGAALMEKRELVRDMVVATRAQLRRDGWAVGLERDVDDPEGKGRSVSVKIRVHKDLRYPLPSPPRE